jgi:CRISPR type I-E-associated protein CasA/Cse1
MSLASQPVLSLELAIMLNHDRDEIRFNLIDDPWLPCITRENERCEVGLRELLHECQTFRDLDVESPVIAAGIYRLILAFLHSALSGPRTPDEWVAIYRQHAFPTAKIERYVERWRNRFELFHPTHPFYQCSNFQLAIPRAANQLAPSCVKEHKKPPDLLTPAQVARALVANQSFALGGGAGTSSARFGKHPNFSHAPLVARNVVLLKGRSLFESLLFNLPLYNEDPLGADRPAWERESNICKPGERSCNGYLDLLTWQSRCVSLIPERGGVRHMYYAQGEILNRDTRPEDPLTLPHRASRHGEPSVVPRDRDWDVWGNGRLPALTQLGGLFREGLLGHAPPIHCAVLGMINERAHVIGWTNESFSVPMRLLHDPNCAVCHSAHG